MRESTAVFLGFGVVGVGIVAVPIAIIVNSMHVMDREPTNVGGPISREFRVVPVLGNGSAAPVPAVDGLLPLGMPGDFALRALRDNGFDCTPRGSGAFCRRTLQYASSREDWSVTLTFDAAGHIASRFGSTRATSL